MTDLSHRAGPDGGHPQAPGPDGGHPQAPGPGSLARDRADQSVSARFTRVMNATPSRWGMLTDPSIVGIATAPVVVALVAAIRLEAAPTLITALQVLAAVPLAIAVAMTLYQAALWHRGRR